MSETILVRHVSTPGNKPPPGSPKLHRGVADIPPSAEGMLESRTLARRLVAENPDIVEIETSPLERTKMMCAEIAEMCQRLHGHRPPVKVRPEVNTWDTGVLAGRPMDTVKPILKTFAGEKRQQTWPGMNENFEHFLHRWLGFLDGCLKDPRPGCIVVCTQGTNVGTALEWDHAGRPSDLSKLDFDYDKVETVKPAHWVIMNPHPAKGHSEIRNAQGKTKAISGVIS